MGRGARTFEVSVSVLVVLLAGGAALAQEPTTVTFQPGDGGAYSDTEEAVLQAKYPDLTRETATEIEVGTYYDYIRCTVLRFPSIVGDNEGQIPVGATIVSAKLKLKSVYARNEPIGVFRLVESHDIAASDAISWNRRAAGTLWTVPGAAYVSETEKSREGTALDTLIVDANWTYFEWDVASAVQAWAADPSCNYGFVIENRTMTTGQNFGGSRNSYMDRRPILEVSYTAPGPDTTPPGSVTALSAVGELGQVTLSWTNPTDSDYAGALVVRKLGSAPTGTPADGTAYAVGEALGDGTVVFVGAVTDTGFIDTDITTDTYYYTVFARDVSLNYSSGVTASATPTELRELVFQMGDGTPYSETYDADLTTKYPDGVYDMYDYITSGPVYEGMRNGIIRFSNFIGAADGQLPYGAQVETATLELYGGYACGQDVSVYRLAESFLVGGNSPSWSYHRPDEAWAVAGASYVSETEKSREGTAEGTHLIDTDWQWYSFDVTSTVQDYANLPGLNYGWVLDNPSLTTNQTFKSSEHDWTWARPILKVKYAVLPDTTPPELAISTPAMSDVSPAFVEGTCNQDAASVFVSVNGADPVDALRGNPTSWYLNVPLSPSAATHIVATALDTSLNSTQVEQAIAWEATDIPNSSDFMVREGDSLLLTATGTGTVLEIDPGTGVWENVGAPGDTLVKLFDSAGVYTVRSRIDGGSETSIDVTVVSVDLRGYVACHTRFTRELEVYAAPVSAAAGLAFGSEDPEKMSVSLKELTSGGARLRLTPTEDAYFEARLGVTGPVVARQLVQVFNYWSTARYYVYVVPEGEEGGMVGTATFAMEPCLPDIELRFAMATPGVTFDGGTATFSIMSDADLVPQDDGSATYDYNIHYAPGVEIQCHGIRSYQHSASGVDRTGGDQGDQNGNQVTCSVRIKPAPWPINGRMLITATTINPMTGEGKPPGGTYQWSYSGGGTFSSPTAETTGFTAPATTHDGNVTLTYQKDDCTCTDTKALKIVAPEHAVGAASGSGSVQIQPQHLSAAIVATSTLTYPLRDASNNSIAVNQCTWGGKYVQTKEEVPWTGLLDTWAQANARTSHRTYQTITSPGSGSFTDKIEVTIPVRSHLSHQTPPGSGPWYFNANVVQGATILALNPHLWKASVSGQRERTVVRGQFRIWVSAVAPDRSWITASFTYTSQGQ